MNIKSFWKKLSSFLVIFTCVLVLLAPKEYVKADPVVAFSVNKTSVNIGDTVTITISINSGYAAQGAVHLSNPIFSPSADVPFTIGSIAGQSDTASFSFTATGAGTCTFSAQVITFDDLGDESGVKAVSATVTVNNSANTEKSSDNSLKSLMISAGTLSPAFSSGTTSYTATVENSVTSIAVTAVTTHNKASITAVSGNTNLAVGNNTVSIVVTAENGTTKTYKIVVNRKKKEESNNTENKDKNTSSENKDKDKDKDNSENKNTEQKPKDENDNLTDPSGDIEITSDFTFGGKTLISVEKIPEDIIPKDFSISHFYIGDISYPCVQFDKGDLTLFLLMDEGEEDGAYYIYDKHEKNIYPFIKFDSESGYLIALLPSADVIPSGCVEITLPISGKGSITAYQRRNPNNSAGENYGFLDFLMPETVYADEVYAEDFYLLYGMNQNGDEGWYQYDAVECTYQRAFLMSEDGQSSLEEENLATDYKNLKKEFKEYKTLVIFAGAIAAVIIIILLVSVIVLAVSRKKDKNGESRKRSARGDDEEDESDFENEDEFADEYESEDEDVDYLKSLAAASEEKQQDEFGEEILIDIHDIYESEHASVEPAKPKFDTIDLTKTSEEIKLIEQEDPSLTRFGDVILSPNEEMKHILSSLSEGESVDEDDDDFTLLDL